MRLALPVLTLLLACDHPPLPDNSVGDSAADVGLSADKGTQDAQLESDAQPDRDSGRPPELDATIDGAPDANTRDRGTPPPVAHLKELRGAWIATVFNINFPSRAGLSARAQQDELRTLLDAAAAAHLNAVFFQVRPEGDALYASELEPWSRFLTGTQGQDPGFDPLLFAIAEAHARGLELHAWLNPYRARASAGGTFDPKHMAVRFPDAAYAYNGTTWMDPASADARAHTVAVIRDIVTRYDVDGIHFDDYFYPYPGDSAFPDADSYAAYQAGGGDLARNDWRRRNVHLLVQAVHEVIEATDPDVRFGISPFGIYRPGIPEGIVGLDQYDAIFADPVVWLEEGWVDYLAPQLYWNANRPQQDYETLLRWWTGLGDHEIHVGNYLSQLGESGWDVAEFRRQLGISRDLRQSGSWGNIFFHIEPLVTNQAGVVDMLLDEFYPTPVLTPPLPGHADGTLAPPTVEVTGAGVQLSHPDRLRGWVFYRGGRVDSIRWAPLQQVELQAGEWAVSAVNRAGVESPPVVFQVP